jgi:glycosyltransferase involved in cell wall biosynthesis
MVGHFPPARLGAMLPCVALAEGLEGLGWRVLRTSKRLGRARRVADMLWTTWSRRREYGVAQVDVFSGRAFSWAEWVVWELSRIGRPTVLALHGGLLPQFARRSPARVRRLLRRAHAVVAPSPYLAAELGPYRAGIEVIPNGIALEDFPFRLRRPARPRLVWVRSFHEVYNPLLALRVVDRLRHRHPEVHLTMAGRDRGDGTLPKVREAIRGLRLEQHVTLAGAVEPTSVPQILSGADVFLNTSRADNTPLSVLEAMASGLCVVTTGVGGIPYLFEDGRQARLTPDDDAEAMADSVECLLTEPEMAERLSREGRRAAEGFDLARVVDRWSALLGQTARGSAS